MIKLLKKSAIMLFVGGMLCLAGSGIASDSRLSETLKVLPNDFCFVGVPFQDNDLANAQADLVSGQPRTFMILVDPTVACPCPDGYNPSSARLNYYVPLNTTVPYNLFLTYGFRNAVSTNGGSCDWEPGNAILWEDTPITYDSDFTGTPQLGRSIFSGCVEPGSPYYLYVTISTDADQPFGLQTNGDGTPDPCIYWMDDGTTVVNMTEAGLLTIGDFIFGMNGECCSEPVADEASSWGDMKARYR